MKERINRKVSNAHFRISAAVVGHFAYYFMSAVNLDILLLLHIKVFVNGRGWVHTDTKIISL